MAVCWDCGRQLYQRNYRGKRGRGVYSYYYCPDGHGRNIPSETAEKIVYSTFLAVYGGDPVLERVYIPASNHQTALEAAIRAVDELSSLASTITPGTVRNRLTEQMRALSTEIERLEALPNRPAGWEQRETGVTYRQAWADTSPDQKRALLVDKQVEARLKKDSTLHFEINAKKPPEAT